MMKSRFLAGCALLTFTGPAAMAGDLTYGSNYYQPPPSQGAAGIFGDVNLSGTYFGGDVDDDFSLDLGGSIVVPFGNGWNAALDSAAGYKFQAGEWVAGGTGHVFYASPRGPGGDGWAAGAFVHGDTDDTDDTVGGGVEAAGFVNNVDLIGKAGYFNASSDYWATTGTANVYFDEDTALSGSLGGFWVDGDSNAWEADVGIEHRINGSRVSAFGELGYSDLGDSDEFRATGGARVLFGDWGGSLQEFNRRNPF